MFNLKKKKKEETFFKEDSRECREQSETSILFFNGDPSSAYICRYKLNGILDFDMLAAWVARVPVA